MPEPRRSRLLVSVRSAAEAEAALAGGADLIDVKEPRRGPLGRADDATVNEVLARVAGRRPVSAAMGELREADRAAPAGVRFLKWGLAGCQRGFDWRGRLLQLAANLRESESPATVVAVAYADWREANSPPVREVLAFACSAPGGVFLIDTWTKAPGKTLLDTMSRKTLTDVCQQCHAAGVQLALAGSLGIQEIQELRDLRPDWFAVRGAACEGGRDSTISAAKVAALTQCIRVGLGAELKVTLEPAPNPSTCKG